MFKVTGTGPAKAKLTPDYSTPIASDNDATSVDTVTWAVSREAQIRSEVLLLYPQDVMTPPDTTSAGNPGGPQENGSLSTTVSQAATGDAKIDGILSGVKWAAGITYSDTDAAADYQAGYFSDADNDGISAQNEGFSQFTAQQTLAMHTALNNATYTQLAAAWGFSIEGFTNLTIDYVGAGASTATIRAANSSDPGTAYAYYPNNSIYGGDTFFGNAYDSSIYTLKNPVAGNYAWHTMLHELGHSLGLKHGQETGGPANVALPYAWDSVEFSVMTYRSYVGAPLSGYSYEQWGAPQTYMMLDIAALQTMYGADYSVQSGDTVYSWSPTTGETYINGSLAIDPGGNRIFATIWDGGGIDTYDLSNYSTDLTLDLNPGSYSVFSDVQLAYLGAGNYARGNIFNALLYQSNSASMIENATGGSGDDSIVGNYLDNVLTGGGGNDYLFGGEGNDTLYGGAGNDIIDGSYGFDLIYGGSGNDIIYGSWTTDTVYGEAGDDSFVIRQTSTDTEYGDNTDGGTGIDLLDLSQISNTYGAIVDLSSGTWQYNPLYGGPWTITGVENVNGTQLDDVITGDSGANILNGNGGNDLLVGGGGNDILSGGAGNDQLRGGDGNDVFDGGSGQDIFYGEGGNDTLKIVNGWNGGYGEIFVGGAGIDTFDFSGTAGLDAHVNLTDGEFWDINFPAFGPISLASVENVIGGSGADDITGSGEANALTGNGGNDALYGLAGNDSLDGGAGNDILDGGAGIDVMTGGNDNDTYYVDNVGDNVVEGSSTGGTNDRIFSSVSYSLSGRHVETLTLTGSAAITATGNNMANTLIGNSVVNTLLGMGGNDILDGGAGADTLDGGTGDDSYYVDNAGDDVVENSVTGGTDQIFSSVSYSLSGRYVETLTLTGSSNINATGNNQVNTLIGNSGANTLLGMGGDDAMNAGDGDDVLNGGTGADTMTGGNGNDTYYVDNAGDNVVEGSTGGASDQIFSSVSYSLSGRYVETLTLTGSAAIDATGNNLANTLIGNSAVNTLLGMGGNDILDGGGGNDILEGGTGDDSLDGGTGTDTASYASASSAVTVSLAIAGAQATGGAGSDTLANIENLTGSAFDDTLTGNSGNNVLRGEAGADRMIGGDGNDTYYVDNSGDIVVENSTGGTADRIFSAISYSLSGGYVETLALTGSGNINATGNNQDNVLTGNGGNNVIQGNGGNDTINGGLGADTLTGGSGADLFAFSSALGGGNIDAITDYTVTNDTIQLDDSVFAGLALGALSAGAFYIGTAAHDSTDRIIYNSSTGALLFDADGNGAGAAVQFATLSTGLALVASEFVVV